MEPLLKMESPQCVGPPVSSEQYPCGVAGSAFLQPTQPLNTAVQPDVINAPANPQWSTQPWHPPTFELPQNNLITYAVEAPPPQQQLAGTPLHAESSTPKLLHYPVSVEAPSSTFASLPPPTAQPEIHTLSSLPQTAQADVHTFSGSDNIQSPCYGSYYASVSHPALCQDAYRLDPQQTHLATIEGISPSQLQPPPDGSFGGLQQQQEQIFTGDYQSALYGLDIPHQQPPQPNGMFNSELQSVAQVEQAPPQIWNMDFQAVPHQSDGITHQPLQPDLQQTQQPGNFVFAEVQQGNMGAGDLEHGAMSLNCTLFDQTSPPQQQQAQQHHLMMQIPHATDAGTTAAVVNTPGIPLFSDPALVAPFREKGPQLNVSGCSSEGSTKHTKKLVKPPVRRRAALSLLKRVIAPRPDKTFKRCPEVAYWAPPNGDLHNPQKSDFRSVYHHIPTKDGSSPEWRTTWLDSKFYRRQTTFSCKKWGYEEAMARAETLSVRLPTSAEEARARIKGQPFEDSVKQLLLWRSEIKEGRMEDNPHALSQKLQDFFAQCEAHEAHEAKAAAEKWVPVSGAPDDVVACTVCAAGAC